MNYNQAIQYIYDNVYDVEQRYHTTMLGIVPIDLNRVVSKMNAGGFPVVIYPKSDLDMEGASAGYQFDENNKQFKIIFNKDFSEERIRYSISFVLGYMMLGNIKKSSKEKYIHNFNDYGDENIKEVNRFVAKLLVPEIALREYVKVAKNVESLAQHFGVTARLITKQLTLYKII